MWHVREADIILKLSRTLAYINSYTCSIVYSVIQQEKQSVREEVVKSQLIEREEWEQRIREELEEQLVTERSKLENRDTELNNLAQQLMEVREDISCKMDQAHVSESYHYQLVVSHRMAECRYVICLVSPSITQL